MLFLSSYDLTAERGLRRWQWSASGIAIRMKGNVGILNYEF